MRDKLFFCEAEQGSNEWKQDRLMCITGSQIHRMMAEPTKAEIKAGEVLSKGAKTYALELATDGHFGFPKFIFENASMRRGTELEPFARHNFELVTGLSVRQVGFIKMFKGSIFGCSLDGLIDNDTVIEIKCRERDGFASRIINGIDKKEYQQIQWNLHVTGASLCYAIDYTDELEEGNLLIEKIVRDEEMIADMEIKSKALGKLVLEYLDALEEKTKTLTWSK